MSREDELETHLRAIIAAYADGEGLDDAVNAASDYLTGEEPEPVAGGEVDQARPESVPDVIVNPTFSGSVGDLAGAYGLLYAAARRLLDQGPSASTMAQLRDAVAQADALRR